MHLCIVCSGYWEEVTGGAEYQLYLLAEEFARRGHRVSYVFESTRQDFAAGSGVELYPLSTPRLLRKLFNPAYFLAAPRLFSTLDRLRPDLVMNRVGNAWTGILARYCNTRGIPFVWHVANVIDLADARLPRDKFLLNRVIDRLLMRYGIRNCRNIVAQAQYQSDLLEKRFGRPASLVLPNFHPVPEQWSVARSGPCMVVWIGKYKQKKNPELFASLAALFAGDPDYQFIMVGNASENSYQRGLAARIAAEGYVEQLGELPIEQVNAVLERAHVLVNTSTFEGFPNTFIQAWMRGVPVASLDFDPDDVIRTQDIGFRSGSVEALASDIRRIGKDPHLREDIGRRAREFSVGYFGLEGVLDRYEAFMSRVLGR